MTGSREIKVSRTFKNVDFAGLCGQRNGSPLRAPATPQKPAKTIIRPVWGNDKLSFKISVVGAPGLEPGTR
jgi:hypothetical protein